MAHDISVMTNKSLERSLKIFESINDVIKGFGIVGGGIFASMADWVFGSVTFSVLFSNYGFGDRWGSVAPFLIGLCISMGAWGVQLILWQILMSGKYAHISNGNWTQKLVLGAVILMKLADDVTDIMAVFWMLKDNPFKGHMDASLYTVFIGVVFFLVWVLVGFSELFVSMSIALLKPSSYQSNQKKPYVSQQQFKPIIPNLNSDIYERLPKKKFARDE